MTNIDQLNKLIAERKKALSEVGLLDIEIEQLWKLCGKDENG